MVGGRILAASWVSFGVAKLFGSLATEWGWGLVREWLCNA